MALIVDAHVLLLDPDTGDLVIADGDLVLVSGIDAVAQLIQSYLLLFRGEWFLDESAGIPYFEDILVKNPNLSAIREIFRQTLLEVPGVLSVESLSLELSAERTLSVDWKVDTDLGELTGVSEV
jgi:hypothetical protein